MYDVRNYIQSVAENDMDYIRCDEVFKTIYFNKNNPSYDELIKHCLTKYGDFQIQHVHCDRGFVWIWSKNKECRDYIKQYVEKDIEQNWATKYVPLDNGKISILYGRPCNDKQDKFGQMTRYNEWRNLFAHDAEAKKDYFWNKFNKKCYFVHKYIPDQHAVDQRMKNHQLCIIVNFKDYESANDAKQAMEDIADRIYGSMRENIETIPVNYCVEYQVVLASGFDDRIDSNILFDGDFDKLYVKHDDDGKYEEFKAMLFEEVIPNTVIVDDFDNVKDIHIFRRLLVDKLKDLKYVHSIAPKGMNKYSVIIHDERIKDAKFREKLNGIIKDICENEMHLFDIGKEYIYMIVGPAGQNLDEILKYCELDSFDRALIQICNDNGTMHIGGVTEKDERLDKFKQIVQNVIGKCEKIDLSAKEWKHLRQNRLWNVVNLQNEFEKCCLSMQDLNADGMLFYGSQSVKRKVINKIALDTNELL